MRIAFLFNHDWNHEFAALERGEVPRHRVFGAADLVELGHEVIRCEVPQNRLPWKVRQAVWAARNRGEIDVIVATHEAAALPTLVLRRLRLVRTPVLVLTVAASNPRNSRGLRGALVRWALRGANTLTVYASAQRAPLARLLRTTDKAIVFVPLGIDTDFFAPTGSQRTISVLSVGTNEGKDYATLIAALPDAVPCIIVTDHQNIELARPLVGTRLVELRHDVHISTLRDLYTSAGVVVIPLHDFGFSSGQTVLLENEALGTPLIVSDVDGIRDYAPNAVRVPPGDVGALRAAIHEALRGTTSKAISTPTSTREAALVVERLLLDLTTRQ